MTGAPASNSMSVRKLAAFHVGAIVFSESREYFKAKDLSDFLAISGAYVDEEMANEICLALTEQGMMREIGPGVYAKPGTERPAFGDEQNNKLAEIFRDIPSPGQKGE